VKSIESIIPWKTRLFCQNLSDVQSLLKNLFKGIIEEMLESEMDDHFGYDKQFKIL
jgi:transposase-like protein